jgi:hypothetical protein
MCAFESKGIVYYVNTEGVWATNGLSVTKLSAVIEDQWFLSKGSRFHTINPYEDGMIVSVAKHTTDKNYLDADSCRTFYSKLDPIAWTEWNFNRHGLGLDDYHIGFISSTTAKVPTFLNAEPTVYVLLSVTNSTEAAKTRGVMQLLIMDGGVDEYIDRDNTAQSQPVGIYLKTKLFDGGNPYRKKRAKRGWLEVYSSEADHEFESSWDIDYTVDQGTEIELRTFSDFTVGVGSNIVIVPGAFFYRRSAYNLRAELQSATAQIKIKDIAVVQDTGRNVFEQVD